jgi:xanthine dehydrogenase accessory factor
MARLAGYAVRVIDPRAAFATEARFPEVTLFPAWPEEVLAKTPLGNRSALVVLAHDPKIDDPALEAALASPAFYIGALGSKKTHTARLARLAERGFTPEALARILGPVGLPIGARSPAEIALSILAQMTQTLRT